MRLRSVRSLVRVLLIALTCSISTTIAPAPYPTCQHLSDTEYMAKSRAMVDSLPSISLSDAIKGLLAVEKYPSDYVLLESLAAAHGMLARKLAAAGAPQEQDALRQTASYYSAAERARLGCGIAPGEERAALLRKWGDALAWLVGSTETHNPNLANF
jgi:hypothetical protein